MITVMMICYFRFCKLQRVELTVRQSFYATLSEVECDRDESDEWLVKRIGRKFERYIFYLKKHKNEILVIAE